MSLNKNHVDSILNQVADIVGAPLSRDEKLLQVAQLLQNQVLHYDWVGFYLTDTSGSALELGPYVGAETEHTNIPFGKGICGQVAVSESKLIIQDVHLEDNYLSCSDSVNSEIVFPIMKNEHFVGELDIDSHARSPFSDQDTLLLESICNQLAELF